MPAQLRASKRKSTAEASQKSKKPKKVVEEVVEITKSKKPTTSSASPIDTDATLAAKKPSRKRAADFFEAEDVVDAPSAPLKAKKAKKAEVQERAVDKSKASTKKSSKSPNDAGAGPIEESTGDKVSESNVTSKRKKSEKSSAKIIEVPETTEAETEEDELDDQTAALLKGFESSEDEEEIVDDATEGIQDIPSAPTSKALQKKLKTAAENDEKRGVVYVGRIPHGFYEHQMRAYFSQFGDITRLRLSRNKKTGASKHYAFVEFQSSEVARIVADTMDKYLMFNHILQVRTIPPERVHEHLFAGANSRFKAVPRNKLAGKQLRQPLHREGWEKRIIKENKRRAANSEKLKAIGYDFESPTVRSVDQLAVKAVDSPTDQLVLTEEPHNSHDEDDVEKQVTTQVESKPGKTKIVETVVKKRKVSGQKSGGSLESVVNDKKASKSKSKKTKALA